MNRFLAQLTSYNWSDLNSVDLKMNNKLIRFFLKNLHILHYNLFQCNGPPINCSRIIEGKSIVVIFQIDFDLKKFNLQDNITQIKLKTNNRNNWDILKSE